MTSKHNPQHLVQRAIDPDLRAVRVGIFGRERPPFRSEAAAVRWVEQQARQYRRTPQSDPQVIRERITAFLQELETETGLTWKGPTAHVPSLAYCRPNEEQVRHVPAWPRTALGELASLVNKIAAASAMHPVEVLRCVLMGRKPRTVPVSMRTRHHWIRLSADSGVWHREVELTIRTPDLSENYWRRLHRTVRHAWEAQRYQKPHSHAKKVLEVVQRLGGVPEARAGRTAFWEKVRGIVNGELARKPPSRDQRERRQYTSWRSVCMAYKRNAPKRDWAAGIVTPSLPPVEFVSQRGARYAR